MENVLLKTLAGLYKKHGYEFSGRCAEARGVVHKNRPENSHPLALSILDTVEYAQDHFHYGYHIW